MRNGDQNRQHGSGIYTQPLMIVVRIVLHMTFWKEFGRITLVRFGISMLEKEKKKYLLFNRTVKKLLKVNPIEKIVFRFGKSLESAFHNPYYWWWDSYLSFVLPRMCVCQAGLSPIGEDLQSIAASMLTLEYNQLRFAKRLGFALECFEFWKI